MNTSMKRIYAAAAFGAASLLALQGALAQAQTQSQTQSQTRQTIRDRDIYGSQLMNRQERNEYRARMQQARTAEERERVRAENHERMQARAKERGVTLPDQPPAKRGGARRNAGPGAGGGMGPGGGGMGPGAGPGGGGR